MLQPNTFIPHSIGKIASHRKWFTPEEDKILLELVNDDKKKNWTEIATKLPGRTARQCRDRYNNTLKNQVEKKPWTKEEDELIITKFLEIGPKWVKISSFLKGRSGNNIKNRWHKYINRDKKYVLPAHLATEKKIQPRTKPPQEVSNTILNNNTFDFNFKTENTENTENDIFYGYMDGTDSYDYFCLGKGMTDPFTF
ncbi:Myb-like DNA-binding domain containing protein [Histomonas meleagridis]|uniref:Myb-like DNA-binding domain containing protein n=1 Tax=Histomonas meleagridis TaxID=135588 RepID=UPI0035594157|nr:Myb-like DNA-binding domain containing protein [Histomonas meleagridis]KAH0799891.1 Myb-like DNA-binding domain containing protein [Histomonas meleagridis]